MTSRWDRVAPAYDRSSAWVERRWLADGRRWLLPRAHSRVLDVGVGTGTNLDHYGPDVALVGVDASEGMLAQAREKHPGAALDLRVADATALPFADGQFDAVVATYMLCCVPDPRAVLAEMVRVLRPGGDLLIADHVVATTRWLRLVQKGLEAVTVRASGEHLTRRPLTLVEGLGVRVVEASRPTRHGALEMVHARKP